MHSRCARVIWYPIFLFVPMIPPCGSLGRFLVDFGPGTARPILSTIIQSIPFPFLLFCSFILASLVRTRARFSDSRETRATPLISPLISPLIWLACRVAREFLCRPQHETARRELSILVARSRYNNGDKSFSGTSSCF